MKIYLAGPMSNFPDHNYPQFTRVCGVLREAGYFIASPHEDTPCDDHSKPEAWTYYLRRDLRLLLTCEGIALLPGYLTSRGAMLELTVARALEFTVYDYVEGKLVKR